VVAVSFAFVNVSLSQIGGNLASSFSLFSPPLTPVACMTEELLTFFDRSLKLFSFFEKLIYFLYIQTV
jgi:hypothetical protein